MWSFQIASVRGIPIRVHLTFFLILVWGAFQYSGGNNNLSGLLYGATLTLLLFGIVLLHELGHSIAALAFKIPVLDITLLPFGGLARLSRMPDKPWQELIVAAAGPVVNVVLLFLLFPFLVYFIGFEYLRDSLSWLSFRNSGFAEAVRFLFVVNLTLLIFNLIPAFPLDGGRIFRAFLAFFLSYETATRIAVWIGQGFAIFLAIYGWQLSEVLMIVVAIFIFLMGGAEGRAMAVKKRLDGLKVADILSTKPIVLQTNYSMFEAASLTFDSRRSYFPVLWGNSFTGVIGRADIKQALEQGQNWRRVSEVVQREVIHLDSQMSLTEVRNRLVEAEKPVAAIFQDQQFLGLVGFEDLEKVFQHTARN